MKQANSVKECFRLVRQLSEEGQQDVLKYIEYIKYRENRTLLEKLSTAELIDELKRRNGI